MKGMIKNWKKGFEECSVNSFILTCDNLERIMSYRVNEEQFDSNSKQIVP